ncbi:MAG: hypothetical protein COA99_14265 [Moraxellaceae bacterium]|nr:MAG: hypothetical protein COA99_14265 [Moraxellaceae bacterium]
MLRRAWAVTLLLLIASPSAIASQQSLSTPNDNIQAGHPWRILIVAQHDSLGLAPGNPAYTRVNEAIFTQLQRLGFEVLSLGVDPDLPACLKDVCVDKTEQELVTLVKQSQADIDLLVLFSVRYVERPGAAVLHREISVPSHMVDVKTGRRVGQWDDDGTITQPIADDCINECLRKRLSDYSRQIGQDTGLAIAHKLKDYQRRFDYYLTFEKFARGELLAIEGFLEHSEKDSRFRDIKEGSASADHDAERYLLHYVVNKTLVYDSMLPVHRFRQLLEQALDEESIDATIVVEGYQVRITRDSFPYLSRYIVGLLILLALISWLAKRYTHSKHQRLLQQLKDIQQVLATAPSADFYRNLMVVHRLLKQTASIAVLKEQHQALVLARQTYTEQALWPSKAARVLGDLSGLDLLAASVVEVGRSASDDQGQNQPAITLGYQRLSQLGKQNTITCHANGFSVADLDSSNGSWLDDETLLPGKALKLAKTQSSLYLGGETKPPSQGLCKLTLISPASSIGSLIVTVDASAVALMDKSYVSQNWPNLAHDKTRTWVLLGDALTLGIDSEGSGGIGSGDRSSGGIGSVDIGSVDIGCVRGSTPLAQLGYRDHRFWLSPATGRENSSQLTINQVKIIAEVPLIAGAKIQLAGLTFWLEPLGAAHNKKSP